MALPADPLRGRDATETKGHRLKKSRLRRSSRQPEQRSSRQPEQRRHFRHLTLRCSIALLKIARGCPCAVTALRVGPDGALSLPSSQ
jgi:hypothetical protein